MTINYPFTEIFLPGISFTSFSQFSSHSQRNKRLTDCRLRLNKHYRKNSYDIFPNFGSLIDLTKKTFMAILVLKIQYNTEHFEERGEYHISKNSK